MKPILLIFTCILLFFILKAISYKYILRLQAKLGNGNLDLFKKVLGTNFHYKPRTNGLIRYKWTKLWITIRADFDEDGALSFTEIHHRKFTIFPEYTFSLSAE